MKKDDFGFYGKGLDGYVHYKQSFDQTQRRPGAPAAEDGGPDAAPDGARPHHPAPRPPAGGRKRRPDGLTGWQLAGVTAAALLLIALLMQCS